MFWRKIFSAAFVAVFLVSLAPPAVSADSQCDMAQFVSDVSVPDGASFMTGAAFRKTWRLLNTGTCTWTTAYKLIFVSGDPLGAPSAVNLPVDVPPGQMLDMSVNMTAPLTPGHYTGRWKLSNAAGLPFGVDSSPDGTFWVDIHAIEITTVIYDFVSNAPHAQWKSGAGILPYPGASGDGRGYSFQVNTPRLEDDSVDSLPGLLTVPQNKYNGYIQAMYPEFLVQKGDRFQTLVNCEFGARNCNVTFRLDYMTSNGGVRTLWTWREAHDGRFYRANVDLSHLAGQRVKFILTLLSNGSASGDRALWGAPRILRTGTSDPLAAPPTLTALPAFTSTPAPFGTPPPVAPAACERAAFVSDVTVPDGTRFSPGAVFTKTWRLRNSGSCAWTTSYNFVFYSGSQMNAPTSLRMPTTVYPGQTIDLALNMTAPQEAGVHRGHWILQSMTGAVFGLGKDASMPVWVEINVAGESSVDTGYDFVKNACAAEWKSGAGRLPCPASYDDAAGFILPVISPTLEDGSIGTWGLAAAPQNKYNGYIQGFYPTITVQQGDRFRTTVGCEHGAPCYATFRLDYMNAAGGISTFWTWREQNDGRFYNANIDLSPLAGRSVRFILTVLATGPASGDRVIWGAPVIERAYAPSTAIPPTLTPAATFTPTAAAWQTYSNAAYGFQFQYPMEAQKTGDDNGTFTRILLPFAPETNLKEKYLDVRVSADSSACQSPLAELSMLENTETVILNGLTFLKQTGEDRGAGHIHQWVGYSTAQNGICVNLDFILHSTNPGNYATPPPVFDISAESAIFEQMLSTFNWIFVAPTATPTVTESAPSMPAATETPITAPTPVNLIGPYAVTGVAMEDVLNIRAGAGVGNPIVGSFAWDAVNVMRSGATAQADGETWVEVQRPDGGMGWVNAAYLTEYVTRDAFCADGRIPAMIEQWRQAVNTSNGALFASLASPSRGTFVTYRSSYYTVKYTPQTAQSIFADTTAINWGAGASGIPDVGTFAQIVQPDMADLLNSNYQLICNDASYAKMYVSPWSQTNIHFYAVQKPATPGVDFDWKVWLVGFEYVEGKPYLFGMRRFVWEP
jgi:hypothetical protein